MSATTSEQPQKLQTDLENQKAKEKFIESNAGDGTTVYDQYLHGFPLIMCLLSIFIALFLFGLDQTIVVTLLEEVGTKFNAYDNIGWVSSGYMLTMSIFGPTWGRVSIVFGRKSSLLVAMLLFEAGSLMCALAPSMNVLIGGRVLAGIGGGGIQSLTFIIASELVPISKRAMVFASVGVTFAVSSVCGPLIGGAFTEHVTWRWCFYVNLPLGGVAAVALITFFHPPKTKGSLKSKFMSLDYVGTFLLAGGVVLFLLGLTFGGNKYPWKSAAVICCFVIGFLITLVFCYWNFKYSKSPIIPLEIIKVFRVDFPVLAIFSSFFNFIGFTVYISTYFQVIRGDSALKTGVDLLPAILGTVLSSIVGGLLIKRTRHVKPYSIVGGVVGVVGFGLLSLLKVHSSVGSRIGYLILPGISVGLLVQSALMAAQLSAPKSEGSTILTTTLFNFSRSLGGALGADLSQAVYNSSTLKKIKRAVISNPQAFEGIDTSDLRRFLLVPSSIRNLTGEPKEILLNCLMDSLKNVFYMMTGMAFITFILTVLFSSKRVPHESEMQTKEEYEKQRRDQSEDKGDKGEEEGQSFENNGSDIGVLEKKDSSLSADRVGISTQEQDDINHSIDQKN